MGNDFLARFEEILDRKLDEKLDEKFEKYTEETTKRLDEKFEKYTEDMNEINKIMIARFEYNESRISNLERKLQAV